MSSVEIPETREDLKRKLSEALTFGADADNLTDYVMQYAAQQVDIHTERLHEALQAFRRIPVSLTRWMPLGWKCPEPLLKDIDDAQTAWQNAVVSPDERHPMARNSSRSMSQPLTFDELNIGNRFIAFPTDGDDNGHGGYRTGAYVFEKTTPTTAQRLNCGTLSEFAGIMQVFKVIL